MRSDYFSIPEGQKGPIWSELSIETLGRDAYDIQKDVPLPSATWSPHRVLCGAWFREVYNQSLFELEEPIVNRDGKTGWGQPEKDQPLCTI